MKEKVYIRPLAESDAHISYKWRNDPEVWKYTGNRPDVFVTEEIELKWIRKVLQRDDEKRFAICISETDEYIGNVQLTNISQYEGELHIFIGEKKYWSGGYGTIATSLLVGYAFAELNLQCVYLTVNKNNAGAIKAYENVGFYPVVEYDQSIKMSVYTADRIKKRVSVFMMTYNHEQFIAQAIDGILNQKCDFEYEIVIGDDCSKDRTKEILLDYAQRHPGVFKLILHPVNIGAKKNQVTVLHACKGRYIAICEGDDYWCDNNKLQKQIDFLEANPDYTVCYHSVQELYADGEILHDTMNPLQTEATYTIQDLAKGNFIHTPSVVYRNHSIKELPSWFEQAPAGDYVLHMLHAQFGKIKYFPETMAVYRRHAASAWSSLDEIKKFKQWLEVLALLIKHFDGEVRSIIERQFYNYVTHVARYYKIENNMEAYYDTLAHYLSKSEGALNIWLKSEFKYLLELDERFPRGFKQSFSHMLGAFKALIGNIGK